MRSDKRQASFLPSAAANIAMIRRVADKLGTSLRERVTFVGGVTTALLLTDPASPDVRPTRDVDVVVEIMGYPSYAQLSEELRERGFQESGGAVICRWHTDDLILDVMPTDEAILGFTNRWYPEAVATAQRITLPTLTGEEPEIHIRLISALCFVATKIEAFYGRGNGDYYASHDLEDVVTVVNGRAELVKEIGEDIISLFVARTFADWLALPGFTDVLEGHLPEQGRYRIVLSRFHTVATKHGGT